MLDLLNTLDWRLDPGKSERLDTDPAALRWALQFNVCNQQEAGGLHEMLTGHDGPRSVTATGPRTHPRHAAGPDPMAAAALMERLRGAVTAVSLSPTPTGWQLQDDVKDLGTSRTA